MSKKFTIIGARRYGFFSNFLHTIQHLYRCRIKKRIPIVYWRGGLYFEKRGRYNGIKTKNIWEYYFKPVSTYSAEKLFPKMKVKRYGKIEISNRDVEIVRHYRDHNIKGEPKGCWDTTKRPPKLCLYNTNKECRLFVNGLINKYIHLRSTTQDKIDEFYSKHMQNREIIGIQMRGTCSRKMQGDDPPQRYIEYLCDHFVDHPNAKIFVATDDAQWLERLEKKFPDRVVYYNTIRSSDGLSHSLAMRKLKHRLRKGLQIEGAKAGEDVLIDAILLSKCSILLHGISNVAAVVPFFHPNIKSVCVVPTRVQT